MTRTILPIKQGGTGATAAAQARTNLAAVGLVGDESIAGIKTFLTTPVVANGLTLTAQADGFSGTETGKIGYDSTKKRLVLKHETHNYPVPVDPRNGFRQYIFAQFISPMLEALTWAAAQIYQAAVTFQSTISQAVTSAGAGSTFNQSGTGDIAAFQDAGVTTVRILDQGGVALIPQAGGFQSIAGLLGYDSVKKRLVLYHESHNNPVPIDPRNGCRQQRDFITY